MPVQSASIGKGQICAFHSASLLFGFGTHKLLIHILRCKAGHEMSRTCGQRSDGGHGFAQSGRSFDAVPDLRVISVFVSRIAVELCEASDVSGKHACLLQF
jgi:hypothetical protein